MLLRPLIVIMLLLVLSGCVPFESSATVPTGAQVPGLAGAVHPLIGTSGDGNIFPGADYPFGMVQWSPDTSAGGITRSGGYAYGDRIIADFSLTHMSGAGCAAFEDVPIMPTVRPVRVVPLPNGSPYSDRFSHAGEVASPGYYRATLASGISTELTVTQRTGVGRFVFPRTTDASVLFYGSGAGGATASPSAATEAHLQIVGHNEIDGWVQSGHFCGLANTYTLYFAMRTSRPFIAFGTWSGVARYPGGRSTGGRRSGAWVTFDTRQNRTVQLSVGLSYVGVAGARGNLDTESQGRSFNSIKTAARTRWNHLLGRIQVAGGSDGDRTIFYTALYHCLLFPSTFSDSDGRYRGFDGRVHGVAPGHVHYANFSGWDIYRADVPLLAWLYPGITSDMMQSLVADGQQGGRLPKWPVANDYTGEMNGDPADPILAGAYAFGARGFDAQAALRLMLTGARDPTPVTHGYVERPGTQRYLQTGYIPGYNPLEIQPYGAAATTLEYNTSDYAISMLSAALGHTTISQAALQRSHSWRALFDHATRLIEPRMDSGAFPTPLDPLSMDGFVEGNALQYLWAVPHDLPTLIGYLGGNRAAVRHLDQLFSGRFDAGPLAPTYWAGNETDIEAPWVYDFAGAPSRTQSVVRRILQNRYTTTVGGLPGNDDLGGLSSWAVWAMIGMYPEIPGTDTLALSSPLFPHITIHAGNHAITINAPGATWNRPYVRSLRIDGSFYRRAWISASALSHQKTIHYTLGLKP